MSLPCLLLALTLCQGAPVRSVQKVSARSGGFLPVLRNKDQLGRALTLLGDLDLDGIPDLAVGAHGDDDGGLDRGAAYVLFLRRDGTIRAASKLSALTPGLTGVLDDGDQFGRALVGLGDLDGDGVPDLAAGTNFDDDGGPNRGAVWILFLARDGSVRARAKISSTSGGLGGLRDRDEFGRSLAAPGDLDHDGVPDLVVGAPYDDAGGTNKGALHVLFLNQDGSVKRQQEISRLAGGFSGALLPSDLFGFSLAAPGDLDGDGLVDLVAGAVGDDDGGLNAGALWVLFLGADASVRAQQRISRSSGGFGGLLEAGDQFGVSVAGVGDLDRDGLPEVCVGAVRDDDGGPDRGAAWLLSLNPNGSVRAHQKVSQLEGSWPVLLDNFDWLGSAVCGLGDLDLDGQPDLALGARMDDDLGRDRGAFYVTFLAPPSAAFHAGGRGASSTQGLPSLRVRAQSAEGASGEAGGLVLEASAPLPACGTGQLLIAPTGTAGPLGRPALGAGAWFVLPARAGEQRWEVPRRALGEGRGFQAQLLWLAPGPDARLHASCSLPCALDP